MIVVLGRPEVILAAAVDEAERALGGSEPEAAVGGLAARVAVGIARGGVHVELVGSIGDDPDGDLVAVALGRAGVGHAALLRDPAAPTPRRTADGALLTEAAPLPRLDADDIGLGLRYVPACDVLVIASVIEASAWAAAMEGAGYHGASVIAVVRSADEVTDALTGAIVLLAPDPMEADSVDGQGAAATAFEAFVIACAMRIARGVAPEVALAEAVAAGSWEPSGD